MTIGVPFLAEADFVYQCFVTDWFSLRGEKTEDAGRSLLVGEKLDECILQRPP
jgi:hypothetical protein